MAFAQAFRVGQSAIDQLAHRRLAAGCVGGGDRTGARFHQLDHLPDLRAADLAEDLPADEEYALFLRYISQVLPGLGESSAVLATPGQLFPEVEGVPEADDAVAVGNAWREYANA